MYVVVLSDADITLYACTQTISIPGSTTTVQFIIIDTIILCGDPTKKGSSFDSQSHNTAADEWAWINGTLQSTTADWIFVFGHYPGNVGALCRIRLTLNPSFAFCSSPSLKEFNLQLLPRYFYVSPCSVVHRFEWAN